MLKESIQTDSNISSLRIVLLFSIFSSVIIAILSIILDRDLTGTAAVIGAILLPVAGAKAYQSKQENKE